MIEDLTALERIAASHWKPIVIGTPDDPSRDARETKAAMELKMRRAEESARHGEDAYRLHQAEDKIKKDNAAEAARIERAEHLMQVPVSKTLDKLKAIRDEIASDPSRKESELLRVDQAIAQWAEPNHNAVVAENMLRSVLTAENDRFNVLQSQLDERLFAIESERQALLAKRGRTPAPVAVETKARQRIAIQGETLEEKGAFLDAAVLASPEYGMGDVIDVTNARNALKRGDSAPLEALIQQYGEVEATTNE
jgi:hypothetical protein